MTPTNTPDQMIDDIKIRVEFNALPKRGDVYEFPLTSTAKAQLKSLFETMMAEVVGDTPIPSEDDIWRYTDEGVGKFILLKEQRQRIPQVLDKYFNIEEK